MLRAAEALRSESDFDTERMRCSGRTMKDCKEFFMSLGAVIFRVPCHVGVRFAMALGVSGLVAGSAFGQQSSSLGNGLSAAAIGRGGTVVAERGDPLDAVEGNPAGLAGIDAKVLNVTGVGVFAQGSFRNAANANGRLSGLAGALPYGAFAMPLQR